MTIDEVLESEALPPEIRGEPVRGSGVTAPRDPSEYWPVRLPSPGRCSGRPTLTMFDFDNSGSVSGGNDPIGNRYLEARLALDRVARRCRCGRELVAILHFDRGTGGDAGPLPLDRKGRIELDRALSVPAGGFGISELGPSLSDAYRLVDAYPEHDPVLIAFTDFELFDADLGGVFDDFCTFPGSVHAAVLRSAPPPRLVDDPRVNVTHVMPDSAPGVVASAAFGALTTYRVLPRTTMSEK